MKDKDEALASFVDRDDFTTRRRKQRYLALGITFISLTVIAVIFVTVYITVFKEKGKQNGQTGNPVCQDNCSFSFVESIPENLTYPSGSPSHPSTYSGLQQLINMATSSIEIASFYWTLSKEDIPTTDNSSWQGESLLSSLISAGRDRGIKIKIVQSYSQKPIQDTINLTKYAGAEVRSLNFDQLIGGGILHTKMWLIDRKHYYVGSANLDWRSLTQVKELGTVVHQCGCMAGDIGKIFDAYWYLADPSVTSIPSPWPEYYSTNSNMETPTVVSFNGTNVTSYLSSSPPPLVASGRTGDIDAITDIITNASEFVYIAVMDYFPTTQFIEQRKYWPVIDDALRSAALDRGVHVCLLASYWKHTWKDMINYLYSLRDLYSKGQTYMNIEVRLFYVPAYTEAQRNIPYSRVNHNKYMVTDKTAYIGTSNWAGDYFIDTGGIGFIINQPMNSQNSTGSVDIRGQLEEIFLRDWNSPYAFPLEHFTPNSTSSTVTLF